MKRLLLILLFALAALPARAATVVVQMTRFNTFVPNDITINVGDTVLWTNTFSVAHDTVAFDHTWQGPLLGRGQTFSFTFNAPGTHDYYCTPHLSLGMTGTVHVQGGVQNNPPTATIASPASGATFQSTDTISVSVNATDDNGVTKVELLVDGAVAQTKTTGPFDFSLSLAPGPHTLTARATDGGGLTGTSAPVSINVAAPNQPPTVSISSPVTGSTFTAPADVTIEANATDDNGVARVEFFVNDISIGSDDTEPFSIAHTFDAGSYRLRAVAFDADGLSASSSEITIQVNQPLPSAPTVDLTFPTQGRYVTYQTNGVVTLTATATDADGFIARVEFLEGTTLLGTGGVTNATNYILGWPPVEGRHTITAKAVDNQGNTTISDPVSFTVALQPEFTSRTMLTNGAVRLSVYGTSVVPFIFEYSDDQLATWTPFLTNSLVRRILFFDDETAAGRTNRMYRARSPDAP